MSEANFLVFTKLEGDEDSAIKSRAAMRQMTRTPAGLLACTVDNKKSHPVEIPAGFGMNPGDKRILSIAQINERGTSYKPRKAGSNGAWVIAT